MSVPSWEDLTNALNFMRIWDVLAENDLSETFEQNADKKCQNRVLDHFACVLAGGHVMYFPDNKSVNVTIEELPEKRPRKWKLVFGLCLCLGWLSQYPSDPASAPLFQRRPLSAEYVACVPSTGADHLCHPSQEAGRGGNSITAP